jgi:hypothetical protein
MYNTLMEAIAGLAQHGQATLSVRDCSRFFFSHPLSVFENDVLVDCSGQVLEACNPSRDELSSLGHILKGNIMGFLDKCVFVRMSLN